VIRPQPNTIQGLIDELVLERFAPLPREPQGESRAAPKQLVDQIEERQRVLMEMPADDKDSRGNVVPLRRSREKAA
jgi:hypothetical protein